MSTGKLIGIASCRLTCVSVVSTAASMQPQPHEFSFEVAEFSLRQKILEIFVITIVFERLTAYIIQSYEISTIH